ncbi:MAG: hypothetical protein WDO68_23200 [Gammaproteobacteria bacterium]
MRFLVSDTSILIDLERADLLQAAFSLDAEFVVPDLIYERELRDSGGADLLALGLRVESLDEGEVERAQAYRRDHPRLALPDTFALTLAKSRRWLLLTGDGALRALAGAEEIECHGVLWLIDLMYAERAAEAATLRTGLKRLSQHPRCRLPRIEIDSRLSRLGESDQTFPGRPECGDETDA